VALFTLQGNKATLGESKYNDSSKIGAHLERGAGVTMLGWPWFTSRFTSRNYPDVSQYWADE